MTNLVSSIRPNLPVSSLIHTTTGTQADNNLVSETEGLVNEILDDLESMGVLKHLNHMDISELLNLITESSHIFDATDQNIYQVVMDVQIALE